MKKVKIMLTAIAVMTVVGSALAFTSKGTLFCHYVLQPSGICPLLNQPVSFTLIGAGNELIIRKPASGCPVQAPQPCDKTYTNITFN